MKTRPPRHKTAGPGTTADRPQADNQRGAALLLVLWVIAVLMVVAFEFSRSMRTEAAIARNFVQQTQTRYFAKAGFTIAATDLVRRSHERQLLYHEDQYWPEEGAPVYRINFENPPRAIADGRFQVAIANEGGKVNLNRADRQLLMMMLNRFDLQQEQKAIIVDSILDWRDTDSFYRLNGAEDNYYEHLDKPYECKDADFDSVSELLLVRGVTPEIYYSGLEQMTTVLVSASNVRLPATFRRPDYRRISINAAQKPMLESLFLGEQEAVEKVLTYRQEHDIVAMSELRELVGDALYAAAAPMLTLSLSPFFTIDGIGITGDDRPGAVVRGTIRMTAPDGFEIVSWQESLPVRHLPIPTTEEAN